MQSNYSCPSCGAPITFLSSVSVSAVCSYCRSLVVRRDANIEAIGTMAELPPDVTPFQIGTAGRYKGMGFALIGRARIGWKDGSWNEWCALRDDGTRMWLAEAQGSLIMNAEVAGPDLAATPPGLSATIEIEGITYRVADIKNAELVGSEGELPYTAPKGRETVVVDLISEGGRFGGIEYAINEKPVVFLGEYVSFNDLAFSNLRELPGWERQANARLKAVP